MARVQQLTKEEIDSKRDDLKAKITESKKKALAGRGSPAKDFLNEISDIVKDALKHNVSYKQLTKDIFDIYKFKVSEQTLRAFAQNVLGFEKQKRSKKNIGATTVETKVKETTKNNGRKTSSFNDFMED